MAISERDILAGSLQIGGLESAQVSGNQAMDGHEGITAGFGQAGGAREDCVFGGAGQRAVAGGALQGDVVRGAHQAFPCFWEAKPWPADKLGSDCAASRW